MREHWQERRGSAGGRALCQRGQERCGSEGARALWVRGSKSAVGQEALVAYPAVVGRDDRSEHLLPGRVPNLQAERALLTQTRGLEERRTSERARGLAGQRALFCCCCPGSSWAQQPTDALLFFGELRCLHTAPSPSRSIVDLRRSMPTVARVDDMNEPCAREEATMAFGRGVTFAMTAFGRRVTFGA